MSTPAKQFHFSSASQQKLLGVHADLQRLAHRALEVSIIDFGVIEGLRTIERQRELVASGASKTTNSRHLTGHAIDVGAYVGAELRWDFGLYLTIATAFQIAAREMFIPVVWGACWSRINDTPDLEQAIHAYVARKRREGGRPLIDGPHFELDRRAYP